MSLSEIIQHASTDNNRSRVACVQLGWLDRRGGLREDAPDTLKQIFSMHNPDLYMRKSFVQKYCK